MFNLESFSSASHLPNPKYICNPAHIVLHLNGFLLLWVDPLPTTPSPKIDVGFPSQHVIWSFWPHSTLHQKKVWSFSFFIIARSIQHSKTNVRRLGVEIIWWLFSVAVSLSQRFVLCPTIFHVSLAFYLVLCGACICWALGTMAFYRTFGSFTLLN
jgi:hypothetical protein